MTQDKSQEAYNALDIDIREYVEAYAFKLGWQASRAQILELLNSERVVEALATAYFDAMHEEKWVNEKEDLVKTMHRDSAKAAIAAIIREVRG
jgi:hypothetical protein